MIALDMQTVIISNSIIYATCFLAVAMLWVQARHHVKGLGFWVASYALGALGWLLTVLSGSISSWDVMFLANNLIPFGSILLFFGLQRFTGAKISPINKIILLTALGAFFYIDFHYTFVQPDLTAHDINTSAGLALTNLLSLSLLSWRTPPEIRNYATGTRIAFAALVLISIARILGLAVFPGTNGIIFGNFDILMVMIFGAAIVFLTYSLILMVNRLALDETRLAEQKAKQAVREWETTFNSISELVSIHDCESRLVMVNKAFADTFKIESEELIGRNCFGIVHGAACPITGCPHQETLTTKKSASREIWEPHLGRHLEVTTSPIFNIDGKIAGSVHIARDITQRLRMEALLRESERRYRVLFQNMLDGYAYCKMIYVDGLPKDFIYVDCNESFERLTGLKDVAGKKVSEVIPGIQETNPEIFEIYGRVAMTGYPESFETYLKSSGTWFSISVYSPLKEYFVSVFENITERKKAESRIRASLAEKELLLKEIHHRVKNNMQVISSLLQLQSNFINDREVALLFQESQNRIKSMSLVYNKLYQSRDLAKIDLKEYLTELVDNLVSSYRLSSGQVAVEIDVEDIPLGLDLAIPCGLIVNEVVVNSLKYAFKDGRSGLITIAVHPSGDGILKMEIADNGLGMPENPNMAKNPTLGKELIYMLVEQQLGGKITLNPGGGTGYTIMFKSDTAREEENGRE